MPTSTPNASITFRWSPLPRKRINCTSPVSDLHFQDGQESETTKETTERRYFTSGSTHTRPGGRWESYRLGSSWGSCQLRGQERIESTPRSKEKTTSPVIQKHHKFVQGEKIKDIKEGSDVYETIRTMVQRQRRRRRAPKRRRQRGRGILGILGSAAKIMVKLGKDKRYKRMGVLGATGSYNRRPAPWEV